MADAIIIEDPAWKSHARDATGRFINRELIETIAADMRRDCAVDTGDLLESIRTEGNQIWVGDIAKGVTYWADVEYGTKPHMIFPVNKTYLSWVGPQGRVFAKKVHHPGTKAQPFIRPNFYRYRTAVLF